MFLCAHRVFKKKKLFCVFGLCYLHASSRVRQDNIDALMSFTLSFICGMFCTVYLYAPLTVSHAGGYAPEMVDLFF